MIDAPRRRPPELAGSPRCNHPGFCPRKRSKSSFKREVDGETDLRENK